MCNAFRNQQQRETLHPHDIPGLPWQVVGTDLFQYGGQTYLLVTDFYSKYFEIEHCHLCHQQLEENICEVWNPRESCQRQRVTVQQHQKCVQQQP